jgi:hypothetical protein
MKGITGWCQLRLNRRDLSGERIAYLGDYAGNYSTPGSLPLLIQ